MNLVELLAEAEAKVANFRLEIARASCLEVGHQWEHIGGKNAGCGDGCSCSVPVHHCLKCGDCDYGDTPEADQVRAKCADLGRSPNEW